MRPLAIPAALGLVTLALAGLSAARAATPSPADREAAYQALLAQAEADPAAADWQALRLAFAARPGFRVFAPGPNRLQMFQAVERADCAAALPAARAAIAERFVDADAHLVAAFCEETAGDLAGAAADRAIGRGLIASIETGDGRTPASAFSVIDVDEEYSVLRAMGLKPSSQSLIRLGDHSYDAVDAVDGKGQATTFYFLVDRVLAAEAAALTPGSVSEGGPPERTP